MIIIQTVESSVWVWGCLCNGWIKILDVSFSDFEKNKEFYSDKINTAKFYFDKVLPRAEQHYKTAISGSSNIMNFNFN